MSVSMKFMQVESSIPEANKKSICQFMSYVHQSVNDMSKVYAQNDKRFNYTTPKSFLELINLYRKVLTNKNNELYGKIDRLGNGLEKLRVTGSQVDELKAQLALQEVELAKKVSIHIKTSAPLVLTNMFKVTRRSNFRYNFRTLLKDHALIDQMCAQTYFQSFDIAPKGGWFDPWPTISRI